MRTRSKRLGLAVGVLAGLAAGAGAQGLGLLERFGPDGLPFTADDPLKVGGGASAVRFEAMAGDACAESGSDAIHHDGSETSGLGSGNKHTARPSPADYNPSSFVLEAPFDFTAWVAGINLADGRVGRFRVFPEDPNGWIDQLENAASERGWFDGFTNGQDEPDLTALARGTIGDIDDGWGDRGMENVFSGGPVKEIHLSTLGLAYRDVKPAFGFPIAIKQRTLEAFGDFWSTLERNLTAGGRRPQVVNAKDGIHLFCQQAYIESWVVEMTNLEEKTSAISGNFVMDVAGEQILQVINNYKKVKCVRVTMYDIMVDMGGPIGEVPDDPSLGRGYDKISDYFLEQRWDYIWEKARIRKSGLCNLASDGLIERKAKQAVREKFEPLDDAAALMDATELDDGTDNLYGLIGAYSGLAGRDAKNVFDKFALSVLMYFGQFKPTEWSSWQYVDQSELMMGFDADIDLTSSQAALEAQDGWNYNNGGTYISKAMWLFGNSLGKDENGLGISDATGNDDPRNFTHRLSQSNQAHRQQLDNTPDILDSYAKDWLNAKMDILDPYASETKNSRLVWRERDIIVQKPGDGATVYVDWPPPNYGFGRAQIGSFRAASGGEAAPAPLGSDVIDASRPISDAPMNLDHRRMQLWTGLISIDPVTQTYSVAGIMVTPADESRYFDMTNGTGDALYPPANPGAPPDDENHLSWSVPRPLGTPDEYKGIFDLTGPYRWLTGGLNDHVEADTRVRWAWDFDTAGGRDLDSFHLQQMAETGSAEWSGLFAVQTGAGGGSDGEGRTGFAVVGLSGN